MSAALAERVAVKLDARLSDAELFDVHHRLAASCRARPGCSSRVASQSETLTTSSPVVRDMDVEEAAQFGWPAPPAWLRLLFGTPLYTSMLEGHQQLNTDLVNLLMAERATAASSPLAKSLVGNGWRTDDQLLQRRDRAPFRKLSRGLLAHAESMARYAQSDGFSVRLRLRGWAVWLDNGGSMREHVHPGASYSGVYYVAVPKGMRGGCLRMTDPRPGAQMVVLGAQDQQFMESRLLCPRSGMVVLFPSWVPHSVTPLEALVESDLGNVTGGGDVASPRIAVAFNVLHTEEAMGR